MTGNPASVSVLALMGCLLSGCLACVAALLMAVDAQAGTGTSVGSGFPATGPLSFDMPAQDLGSALNEYSRLTDLAVLIDSVYARRQAGAVQGAYTPSEALQQLLAGTGLRARRADDQSIVISPAPDAPQGFTAVSVVEKRSLDIPGVTGKGQDFLPYIAQVQETLRNALCASPQTRPGPYRLALQVRLNARGMVERFRLLDTTGQPARDAAISNVVRGMAVGAPPPATMAQPVSILLLPNGGAVTSRCPSVVGERGVLSASQAPGAFQIAGH